MSSHVQAAVLAPTRTAAALPPAVDIDFHRSLSRPFARQLEASSARCLTLLGRLLAYADGQSSLSPDLDESALVDDYRRTAVEKADHLLERADRAFDRGRGHAPAPAAPPEIYGPSRPPRHVANLVKPQIRFLRPVDNASDSVWRPLLGSKPHAIEPLDLAPRLVSCETEDGVLYETLAVPHPYLAEIDACLRDYNSRPKPDSTTTTPTLDDLDTRPFALVDTLATFREMLEHLASAAEVAIDLEHHDYRTYRGISCLMQISSRERDFIVDILDPVVRDNAQELNVVFTDPSIVKVFHGAESDIIWLQRDLGLYIVNLFDTYHACRVLQLPKASLAFLLERYIGFKADKRYQLADWRTRPLPAEMLIYARSDTSFLLYIYDKLVSELADAQTIDGIVPLARVAQLSAATAKRVHLPVPPEYDMRWSQLLSKWQKTHEWPPSSKSYKAFRAMYDWRDRVAREMDESPFYILNNAALLALAQHPPRNSHAASALLRASPIGRARVDELVALIAALDGQECPPMPAALEPAQAVPVVVPPIIGAPKRDLWLNPEADALVERKAQASSPPRPRNRHAAVTSMLFPDSRSHSQAEAKTAAVLATFSAPAGPPLAFPSGTGMAQEGTLAVGSAKSPIATSTSNSEDEDDIVTMQLTKQARAAAPSTLRPLVPRVTATPHDYAAMGSLLDNAPLPTDRGHRKRRRQDDGRGVRVAKANRAAPGRSQAFS